MQYHPHGDKAIGDALVVLGQKDLLIDTQGNWGDVQTGDPIWVRINTDPNTQYTAAVWQISLSSSNDSSKLEGMKTNIIFVL